MNIALVEPEIPPNTGTIARLCAATGTVLHLIEPLGFQLTDKNIRRAGLDYWDSVELHRYPELENFFEKTSNVRKLYFSTSGAKNYTQAEYRPGDCLVFGNESRGLPDQLLADHPEDVYNIPMRLNHVRSLNLANCAAIVLYEALRQINL
ncbi:MAG: tRNA (cytidine(34)-2'-O)-methyltransferase [Kiritimatiellales bacterium]|nr:tRNA (cytidine(34)-2'-O)-methyltransferase [Kiritimatiellales bacterium]